MRLSKTLTRTATVAVAASAAACSLAVPAFANAGLNFSTELDMATPGRQVIVAAQLVQGTRNLDLRTRNVELTCEAVAIGDAVSTRLTQCAIYVNGVRSTNAPRALPGVLVASATVSQIVPVGASVLGCATGSAVWSDASVSASRTICTPAQVAAA